MFEEPQRIKIVRKSGTVVTIHNANRAEIRTVDGQAYYVTKDDEVHSFPNRHWWENNG